jgi:hypothetical protein
MLRSKVTYTQSWLQRTGRAAHPDRPGDTLDNDYSSERVRSPVQLEEKNKKRRRSPSYPESVVQSETRPLRKEKFRFEKRARYKTHEDKYEYKLPVSRKPARVQEIGEKKRTKNSAKGQRVQEQR